MKKLIGITQRIAIAEGSGESRDCLARDWYGFLSALGVNWLALPNDSGSALNLAQHLRLDGIILSGGDDIGVFPERDETERALLKWCSDNSRPLLGVCRGFQVLHHWFGGHLCRVNPKLHAGARHRLDGGGSDDLEVNSFHNFSPDFSSLPDGYPLRVRHRCAVDGNVEAAANGLFSGIMWHPERESVPSPKDIAMFKRHFGLT